MINPTPTVIPYEREGGQWTFREIRQQPEVWRHTRDTLSAAAAEAQAFLAPLLARPDLRIILTGAGSSAYIGQVLQPELLTRLGRRVEAIATTDLVSAPRQYFQRNVPTLLVSFARSGGSPESLAAVDLAEQCVATCHHLAITCNAEGALYRRCAGRARTLAILLPEATHDRAFAMTSSFTSMLYAGLLLLAPDALPVAAAEAVSAAGERLLDECEAPLRALVQRGFGRTVYLGSGALAGIAHEAALKLLELTDGAVAALSNTPLGFRHGPKTFLTPDTLVVVFVSGDRLARRYDLDLLRELKSDGIAGRVLALSTAPDGLDGLDALVVPGLAAASDLQRGFLYLLWAQLYAFHRSLSLGRSPDTPSVTGAVHRVVQGVTIHPLES